MTATKKPAKSDQKIALDAEGRDVFGKKLGNLREGGKIPSNIYGKDFKSTAISVDAKTFLKIFREAGETQVIYLKIDKEELPVLITNLQTSPITDEVIHVDFKKIDLTKKTEAQVPVVVTGEAEAVDQKKGDLLTLIDELTVEALPDKIPSEIEIDVTGLAEIDDAIKVSDLKTSKDYEVKEEPDSIIVKIAEHKEEELEPSVPEPAEGEEVEGEEGAEPAEGEAPAEGEEGAEDKAPAEKAKEESPAKEDSSSPKEPKEKGS